MNNFCGCCEGPEILTPMGIDNPPGLSALAYRIGTHGTFLSTMRARLSSQDMLPLEGLKTRDPDDPTLALLDAWATVADVLTFYQERIANEGYLRTATEARSILELARLVGYHPRPGVAASVYLAYLLKEKADNVLIPVGSRAKSLPGPGEKAQTFETAEPFEAHAAWSEIKPRLTRPQLLFTESGDYLSREFLYLKGTKTGLNPNDPLLMVKKVAGDGPKVFARVESVQPEPDKNRTRISIRVIHPVPSERESSGVISLSMTVDGDDTSYVEETLRHFSGSLFKTLTALPGHKADAVKSAKQTLEKKQNALIQVMEQLYPKPISKFVTALKSAPLEQSVEVFALRLHAKPFGHNAGPKLETYEETRTGFFPPVIPIYGEWAIDKPVKVAGGDSSFSCHTQNVLYLNGEYDIQPNSYLVIEYPDSESPKFCAPKSFTVNYESLTAYGIPGQSTRINFDKSSNNWITDTMSLSSPEGFRKYVRQTNVYAQSEPLELADEPIEDPIGLIDEPVEDSSDPVDKATGKFLDLGDLYPDLVPGSWLIVTGERYDLPGVWDSERVMVQSVEVVTRDYFNTDEDDYVIPASPEEAKGLCKRKVVIPCQCSPFTRLTLANEGLAYPYQRDTVTIYGNVVRATHGETQQQVLGSGDSTRAYQQFSLNLEPLTYLPAPTPDGVESSLTVRANDIRWHESPDLMVGDRDRIYTVRADETGKVTIQFGDGQHGARLPSGDQNITATYRRGLGREGNVKAQQISSPVDRPQGVKGVTNPIAATGGADRERPDQTRRNAPLAVQALDRLVSVQDYADFARRFAGIGKAYAVELSDGQQQLVHLTIAGADDIPIDYTSDLYRNLCLALQTHGDPYQPFKVALRQRQVLVIQANIQVLPDYLWEKVYANLQAALLATFSFDRRELGQDVTQAEVISTVAAVPGVAYVDLDILDAIPESDDPAKISDSLQTLLTNATDKPRRRITATLTQSETGDIRPAQLITLSPDLVEYTLFLNERK